MGAAGRHYAPGRRTSRGISTRAPALRGTIRPTGDSVSRTEDQQYARGALSVPCHRAMAARRRKNARSEPPQCAPRSLLRHNGSAQPARRSQARAVSARARAKAARQRAASRRGTWDWRAPAPSRCASRVPQRPRTLWCAALAALRASCPHHRGVPYMLERRRCFAAIDYCDAANTQPHPRRGACTVTAEAPLYGAQPQWRAAGYWCIGQRRCASRACAVSPEVGPLATKKGAVALSWSHERNSLRASATTLVCWRRPTSGQRAAGRERPRNGLLVCRNRHSAGGRGAAWLEGGGRGGGRSGACDKPLHHRAPLGQLTLQRRLIAARRRVASTQHARLAPQGCVLAAQRHHCLAMRAFKRIRALHQLSMRKRAYRVPYSPPPSAKTAVIFPAPPHVGGQSGDGRCTPCNERDAAVRALQSIRIWRCRAHRLCKATYWLTGWLAARAEFPKSDINQFTNRLAYTATAAQWQRGR